MSLFSFSISVISLGTLLGVILSVVLTVAVYCIKIKRCFKKVVRTDFLQLDTSNSTVTSTISIMNRSSSMPSLPSCTTSPVRSDPISPEHRDEPIPSTSAQYVYDLRSTRKARHDLTFDV